MKNTRVAYFNNLVAEETYICECGVVYEFAYGNERYVKDGLLVETQSTAIRPITSITKSDLGAK
jgi:hypothetical protein